MCVGDSDRCFAARHRACRDVHSLGSHGGPRGAGERATGWVRGLFGPGEGEVRRCTVVLIVTLSDNSSDKKTPCLWHSNTYMYIVNYPDTLSDYDVV